MKKRGSLVLLLLQPLIKLTYDFRRAARTFTLIYKHISNLTTGTNPFTANTSTVHFILRPSCPRPGRGLRTLPARYLLELHRTCVRAM
jgi:hypothetical protein